MKRIFGIILGVAALAAAACTTMEAEDTGNGSSWAEELGPRQAIDVMPITVDFAQPATPQASGIMKMNAIGDAPEEAVKISWRLPEIICTKEAYRMIFPFFWQKVCVQHELTAPWEILGQNDDGTWTTLANEAVVEKVEDSITGELSLEFTAYIAKQNIYFKGDMLATLKVALPDHNTGEMVGSIVTFMVAPQKNIRVTLVEASASAPSSLFGQYTVLDVWNWQLIFKDMQNLNGVDLPSVEILESQLPKFSPVKFSIETDFSDPQWGFENTLVRHESNTSFCKVTEVPASQIKEADVQWRFKYEFEDLPLEKASFENGGLFDYNDLVFYVDVLK